MNQEISKRIIGVISRVQQIARDDIKIDSTLEELGLDSFDGINLLFALEDEFNITLPDEAKEIRTVHGIMLVIQQVLENQLAVLAD